MGAATDLDAKGLALESLCSASNARASRLHEAAEAGQVIGMGDDDNQRGYNDV